MKGVMKKEIQEHDYSTNVKEFKCFHCSRRFSKKSNLSRHISKGCSNHTNGAKECPLCHTKHLASNILKHFEDDHDLEMETEVLTFVKIQEFEDWKRRMEEETKTRYVLARGRQKKSNYYCHRSGSFAPRGNGKRKIKKIGSNKINAFCPAQIEVTLEDRIYVHFMKTHIGHDCELERLKLTKEDRRDIANKLSMQIPFDEILNEFKSQNKAKILTRKDLYNIEAEFKINSVRKTSLQVRQIQRRHKLSLSLKTSDVLKEKDCWLVHEGKGIFTVTPSKNCDCSLRCEECKCCIHAFICSCEDSCMKFNMCKHIHLINSFECEDFDEITMPDSPENYEQIYLVRTAKYDVEKRKQELKDKLNSLIDSFENDEQIAAFENVLNNTFYEQSIESANHLLANDVEIVDHKEPMYIFKFDNNNSL